MQLELVDTKFALHLLHIMCESSEFLIFGVEAFGTGIINTFIHQSIVVAYNLIAGVSCFSVKQCTKLMKHTGIFILKGFFFVWGIVVALL